MNSKIVFIKKIGAVEFRKSTRAKYLRIAVNGEKGIIVSVPEFISFDDAEKFVLSSLDWIEKTLQKIKSKKREQTVYNMTDGFSTKFRTMNLVPENRENMRLKIFENSFDIYYPHDADVESDQTQSTIRKFIEYVWYMEANEYLPNKITRLANACQFTYKSLTIKNIRSFWGKCGGDNSIVLSLHVMHLPEHLIDYVILHELCHTVHKNHQSEFWQLLDVCTAGKAKNLEKEMKNYSTKIY
jgi:predicted metal-dependent hydrolase